MDKKGAISDCFQPSILFLFYPCSRLFTCDCLFYFHLYARSFFILYPYGANNVGFMGRADGQCRDTITTKKYIIVAAWGTAKVSALPSEGWLQQDNLVIPGYLQVVLKSLCWAVLLTCSDALNGGEIWSQRLTQLSFVWFLCVAPGNRGTEICAFEYPVYGTCAPPVLQISIYFFHHGRWRAMKCAMFRLFHKLKGKVVTSLFFFTMILSLSPVGKYCMEEEIICCWQHWTQREVLEDGEPKSPKTKCHCSHQWWSWTLSFCFSSWSQE